MARTQSTWGNSPGISASIGIANICRTITPLSVAKTLCAHDKKSRRNRDLPAEAVVYFVIAMALYTHVNLREVLFSLIEGLRTVRGFNIKVTGKSGISQARTRLGFEPMRDLYDKHVVPLAKAGTKGSWYNGMRLVSLDGSTLDVPDEVANRQAFGGPKTYNGAGPFPQIRFVCLAETGTRILFGARVSGYEIGERALAQGIIKDSLKPNMLCMADRGFWGYDFWNDAQDTGANLLFRARSDIKLPILTPLPDGSYLSEITSYRANRTKSKPIAVRVVEYDVQNSVKLQSTRYRIVTTLMDHHHAPADDLARLYHERWEIETAFDEFKTHLRGNRMCLRSKTPGLVIQEFYGLMLAHFTVRKLMCEAACQADIDPDDLSFTHSLNVVRRKIPLIAVSPPEST